jgi:1-aminocyclopropane-1-carboxylate deaminase
MEIVTQKIELSHTTVELYIRREDLIHPYISGNKYRKLKYNLEEAKNQKQTTLLSFGGAYSNHITALAYAGKINQFKTIGIIRGEELESKIGENPTLRFAKSCGMQFEFISREDYRNKTTEKFIEDLKQKWGNFYLVPEGGTNQLAIKGCEEILQPKDSQYDYIACAVGTCGTIAGIINASHSHQTILGFPALKGDFFEKDITKFANKNNFKIISQYHFGGYGKVEQKLIEFINLFYQQNKTPLDPVYTGKMVYGIIDLIKNNYFPKNTKILLIHTGGLQGIEGMNKKLSNKKMPIITHD